MNEHTHDAGHDDVVEALKAELASVRVSPDFATNVRRQIQANAAGDGVDALARELSGLFVSPEFAVRVRQQIEAAPARSRRFSLFDWRWAVPVAAAAVVIVAIVPMRGGAPAAPGAAPPRVQARGPEPRAPQVPNGQQAPHTPQAPSSTANAPGTRVSPAPRIAAALANQRTQASAAASGRQADDTLDVITNQPAILRQLWAAAANVEAVEAPAGVGELVIVPVEVTPVAVQWLVEPPTSGGVTPIIRRVSAAAERSDQ